MLTGHFATALVPYARDRKLPLFTLLLVSQVQDFLIPVDVLTTGQRDLAQLEMHYSHDLLPVLIVAGLVGLGLHLWFRSRKVTLIGVGLVLFHEVCDLLSGFAHNVNGPDTPRLGFDFYRSAPATAFAIEFLLAVACLAYFFIERRRRGDPVSLTKTVVLCGVILVPIVAMLAMALGGRTIFQ